MSPEKVLVIHQRVRPHRLDGCVPPLCPYVQPFVEAQSAKENDNSKTNILAQFESDKGNQTAPLPGFALHNNSALGGATKRPAVVNNC